MEFVLTCQGRKGGGGWKTIVKHGFVYCIPNKKKMYKEIMFTRLSRCFPVRTCLLSCFHFALMTIHCFFQGFFGHSLKFNFSEL